MQRACACGGLACNTFNDDRHGAQDCADCVCLGLYSRLPFKGFGLQHVLGLQHRVVSAVVVLSTHRGYADLKLAPKPAVSVHSPDHYMWLAV